YKAGVHYADANDGHIVPSTGVGSYAISFDDLIGEYMNRNLTQAEINKEYNYKKVDGLQCPSSIIVPNKDWKTGKPGSVRSYAMNTGWQWSTPGPMGFDGITSEKTGDSSVIWQLTDTSNLLYSGEIHTAWAAVGYGGGASMKGMTPKFIGEPIHLGLRSVYVLVDGHTEVMLPSFALTKSRRADR
ncbi:MAG: hypothetical protein HRT88_02665, partial [Lentisphaeraceae bacterium]|nr:hypothetical protein [Lentisphaeraceae bacterium]